MINIKKAKPLKCIFVIIMAIAIKRTPVLKGKSAIHFNTVLAKGKTKETKASISRSIADTKVILANYKAQK